ncbi:hypothetical protein DRJ04_00770 [Candidatus Aerophobetes bacterium]|uniref:DUF1616 domain-containing protein n=1 Tax=Aerophobetes bacterium TaxID=2030807 RepID=A0A662DL78_UNCAE|nr:MAG: hypothetical protein DRJ04_00770 [Candidatus Aerophobetes bacterium]
MKIKIKNELLLIDILSLILIAIISLTSLKVIRIIVGLPFILFFPGYTLIAALFPKKTQLDTIERVALSFGLSIAVVPLIGLILNYTPWGIKLYPILVSLTGFIVVMSAVAWIRRFYVLPPERLSININIDFSSFGTQSKLDKALTVILIGAIIAAIGTLIYVISTPKVGEKFTEFYILGEEGKAEGYPKQLVVGEEGYVILGIVNHEYEPVTYTAKVLIGEEENKSIGPITLKHEEKWEKKISFTPTKPGKNIKVRFLLFKDNQPEPYRSLHLWIDVTEKKILLS